MHSDFHFMVTDAHVSLPEVPFAWTKSGYPFFLGPFMKTSSDCGGAGLPQEVESVNAEVVKTTLSPLAGSVLACISCRYSVPSISFTVSDT